MIRFFLSNFPGAKPWTNHLSRLWFVRKWHLHMIPVNFENPRITINVLDKKKTSACNTMSNDNWMLSTSTCYFCFQRKGSRNRAISPSCEFLNGPKHQISACLLWNRRISVKCQILRNDDILYGDIRLITLCTRPSE